MASENVSKINRDSQEGLVRSRTMRTTHAQRAFGFRQEKRSATSLGIVTSTSKSVLFFLCFMCFLPGLTLATDKVYEITEEEPPGFVGNVARDLNLQELLSPGVFESLRYSIMVWQDGNYFRIDESNSDLFTKQTLDRENLCKFEIECLLNIRIAARSDTDLRKYNIVVKILDINDNAPKFNKSSITLVIPESVQVDKKYALPGATDADRGEGNSVKEYAFVPDSQVFGLEYVQRLDGTLDVNMVVKQLLDRETKDYYSLVLVASDGGQPKRTSSMIINVQVQDDNDHTPQFSKTQYLVQIGENTVPGDIIIQLTATDKDMGKNAELQYRLSVNQNAQIAQQFVVDPVTGDFSSKVPLASGSYTIILEVVDGGIPQRVNQTEIVITVIDTDNNPPVITLDPLGSGGAARIPESANINDLVAYVSVYDPDSGQNGAVKCYSQSAFFDLRELEDDYKVVVARALDREVTPSYRVTVFCEDNGDPRLNDTQVFDVIVEDINDNPPVFQEDDFTISIFEGNGVNDVAVVIPATDRDSGINAKISFTLIDDSKGYFNIPPGSNTLMISKVLDRETIDQHVVKILARDGGNKSLSATATVTINVKDINDMKPKFFKSNYRFFIDEGLPAGSHVGNVSAYDLDLGDGGVFYFNLPSWSLGSEKFKLMKNGTLATLTPLDREDVRIFKFPIEAIDNGQPSLTSSTEVTVEVKDINDNRPFFLYPSSSNYTATVTLPVEKELQPLLKISAIDADEGLNGALTFMMQKNNNSQKFHLDMATGELFNTQPLRLQDAGVYNLSITAVDEGTPPLNRTKYLLVNLMINPVSQPVKDDDINAYIAIGLVCGTFLLAAIIVSIVCFVRRRDKSPGLHYLDNKGKDPSNGSLRTLNASSLPGEYQEHKEANNNGTLPTTPDDDGGFGESGTDTLTNYSKYSVPKLSVGFPGGLEQYNLQNKPNVRRSVDSVAKTDEVDTNDKELNRVTSLRLQQAFQHISSIKSRLITPADTSKAYEWREIHIPGDGMSSLSSRGTAKRNSNNLDSGVGTDDDTVFHPSHSTPTSRPNHYHHHHHSYNPKRPPSASSSSRGVSPLSKKPPHQHHHHHHHYHHTAPHHRFLSQPNSDMSGDSSHPSCSSLPNLCLKPGSDIFVFRPLSARSSESFPSENQDDNCTTTSGSYSIHMDEHHPPRKSARKALQFNDLNSIQDVYV